MRIPLDEDLAIGEEPLSDDGVAADRRLLDEVTAYFREQRTHMVGLPVNLAFDYEHLAGFLSVHGNNAGSPCGSSAYHLHTKHFERAVVEFFARLAGAAPGTAFGYVTNGGTESNLYGAYLGRERHPDAILYASAEAHYSVPKIARILRMEYEAVPVDDQGSMDPEALQAALRRHAERSAVIIATVGTTSRGAIDSLPGIRRALVEAGTERSHLHVDGAFGGLLAALAPVPVPWGFDAGAESIGISGHKVIGSPVPCGVVLAHQQHVEGIRAHDAAVGTDDDTISGSRDALSPVMLWQELRRLGVNGLTRRVRLCMRIADYAAERLEACGTHPTHLAGTCSVVFDAPPEAVCRRWNLLCEEGKAHLIVMPHVMPEHIDRLCTEIIACRDTG